MKIILGLSIVFLSLTVGSAWDRCTSNANDGYEDNYDYGNYYYESPEKLDSDYDSESSEKETSYDEKSRSSSAWPSINILYSSNDDDDEEHNTYAVATYQSGSTRISISCLLFGNEGCDTKCNLKCTLYDCTPRTTCCDNSFHCDCDEIYNLGSTQLTRDDFEFLEFDDLWGKTFEDSVFSTNIRKRIRENKQIEKYALDLLRDSHISGDDVISLLKDEYEWSDLVLLDSRRHIVKTQLMGAGKQLQYRDLDDHLDELLELMEIKPLDGIEKVKYRRRIRQFLKRITDFEDLEELLHLIKLSGNEKLYRLAKSVLKNLGYGFEEDGDVADGKKGIFKKISGDLSAADEEEILDVAIVNQFMPQKLHSNTVIEDDTGTIEVTNRMNDMPLETSSASQLITNYQHGKVPQASIAPTVPSQEYYPPHVASSSQMANISGTDETIIQPPLQRPVSFSGPPPHLPGPMIFHTSDPSPPYPHNHPPRYPHGLPHPYSFAPPSHLYFFGHPPPYVFGLPPLYALPAYPVGPPPYSGNPPPRPNHPPTQ